MSNTASEIDKLILSGYHPVRLSDASRKKILTDKLKDYNIIQVIEALKVRKLRYKDSQGLPKLRITTDLQWLERLELEMVTPPQSPKEEFIVKMAHNSEQEEVILQPNQSYDRLFYETLVAYVQNGFLASVSPEVLEVAAFAYGLWYLRRSIEYIRKIKYTVEGFNKIQVEQKMILPFEYKIVEGIMMCAFIFYLINRTGLLGNHAVYNITKYIAGNLGIDIEFLHLFSEYHHSASVEIVTQNQQQILSLSLDEKMIETAYTVVQSIKNIPDSGLDVEASKWTFKNFMRITSYLDLH